MADVDGDGAEALTPIAEGLVAIAVFTLSPSAALLDGVAVFAVAAEDDCNAVLDAVGAFASAVASVFSGVAANALFAVGDDGVAEVCETVELITRISNEDWLAIFANSSVITVGAIVSVRPSGKTYEVRTVCGVGAASGDVLAAGAAEEAVIEDAGGCNKIARSKGAITCPAGVFEAGVAVCVAASEEGNMVSLVMVREASCCA